MNEVKVLTKNGWEIIGTEKNNGWTKGFINFVALDNINKCWMGIKTTGITEIDKLLTKNKLNQKLQKLGYALSVAGKGYALYAIRIEDTIYIDFSKASDVVDALNNLTSIRISTNNMITYEGSQYELLYKMYKQANSVYSQKVIIVNGKEVVVGKEFKIPGITEIPAEVITNNALETPDLPLELQSQLSVVNALVGDIQPEWEYTRTQYVNNRNYNTSVKSADWNGKIINARVHDINAPEGVIASSLAPLISNATNVDILNKQIAYIEDRILKYAMQYRDGSISGTNKTIAEVMSQNQQAFEWISNKNEHIKAQLTRFIEKVGMLANIDTTSVDLEMMVSPLEKYKLDKMNADLQVVLADANSKNASAGTIDTNNQEGDL